MSESPLYENLNIYLYMKYDNSFYANTKLKKDIDGEVLLILVKELAIIWEL